jgi:hypothetical protein
MPIKFVAVKLTQIKPDLECAAAWTVCFQWGLAWLFAIAQRGMMPVIVGIAHG